MKLLILNGAFFNIRNKSTIDFIKTHMKDIYQQIQQKTILLNELLAHFKYKPGGIGMKEAEKSFYLMARKQQKID